MCDMPNEFVEATNETLNMNNKFKTEFEENCELDTSSKTGRAVEYNIMEVKTHNILYKRLDKQ
jgi:hypothetical protein